MWRFAIFFISGLFLSSIPSVCSDLFLEEVESLRVQGRTHTLNLSEFEAHWEPSIRNLFEKSYQDVESEKRFTRWMNALVNLLRYNYNQQGLDLLKRYAPVACRLDLARAYCDQKVPFNKNNDQDKTTVHKTAATLYDEVWQETVTLMNNCWEQLISAINTNKTISEIDFPFLESSLKLERQKMLRQALSKIYNVDKSSSLIKSFQLSKMPADTLTVLAKDFIYGLDPFLQVDIQNFCWCLNYVLGKGGQCSSLFQYQRNKKQQEGVVFFDDLRTFIMTSNIAKPMGLA